MLEVIAEIGWNFMGDIDLAKTMIVEAKDSGANIAKFQYWNPKKLTTGPWDQDGRKEIYEKAALDSSKIKELVRICKKEEIEFLISVFNTEDAKFISSLGLNNIKIPSHEIYNKSLHEFSSKNFAKVYVSAGAGSISEVESAINIYKKNSDNFVIMHCVSSYPCPSELANLDRINWLKSFDVEVGLSDHTQSLIAPAIAYNLGATVFEKHFTSDKSLPGRDNQFAVNKKELKQMIANIYDARDLLVPHGKDFLEIEKDTITNYRGRWG